MNKPPLSPPLLLRVLAVLMLLGFGGVIAWVGCEAIAQRHYEMEWKARSSSGSSHGVLVLVGAEAVRFGAGLSALGVMLGIWGAGSAAEFARREPAAERPGLFIVLGWLSLGCLVTAGFCIFPPWQLPCLGFYAVTSAVLGFAFGLSDAQRTRWARIVFPGLIGAAIVMSCFEVAAAVSMILGFFAAIGLAGHLLFLSPGKTGLRDL